MPDRASIGLDNPAFHGRVRHASMPLFTSAGNARPSEAAIDMSSGMALSQTPTIISGLLTQPLFKPKAQEKLAPPERSRYKHSAEEEPTPRPVRQSEPAPITEFVSQWDEPVESVETGPSFSIPAARKSYGYEAPQPKAQVHESVSARTEVYEPVEVPVTVEPKVESLKVEQRRQEPVSTKASQPDKTPKGDRINVNLNFSLPKPHLPKLNPREMFKQTVSKLQGYSRLQLSLLGMALFMFVAGIVVSAMTLHTNHVATAKVAAIAKQAGDQPAAGGNNGTASAPSTVKPSSSAISNYTVGPNMPRYLNIPKLGVQHARVLSLGILNSGALATPNNVFDVGWYNESSLPGEPGAMLIDGHVSSWTSHGVFYGIKNLVAGDMVQVVRGDGTVFNYQVVRTQVYDHDNVDMQSAVTAVDPSKPGLNLITCTGDVIKGTNEFNERVVVYTEQV